MIIMFLLLPFCGKEPVFGPRQVWYLVLDQIGVLESIFTLHRTAGPTPISVCWFLPHPQMKALSSALPS